MRDWDNIKEELKRNSHLFTLIKKSEIEVKELINGDNFILILVKSSRPEGMIHKWEMNFLVEYCDSYDLTFFITEKPFAIYIVEDR